MNVITNLLKFYIAVLSLMEIFVAICANIKNKITENSKVLFKKLKSNEK